MGYLYKVEKFYYVCCRFRGRRFRWSTGFKNKYAAKRALLNAEMRMAEGKDPRAQSGAGLGRVSEGYLTYNRDRVKPRTLADRERYLKRFAGHFGKDMPITEINRKDAMDYKTGRLHSGAGKVVINRELATIRHYFNYAVDRGLCEENPFKRFGALPEPKRDPRILSKEERQTWFRWCRKNDPLLYDLSVVAFFAGLRPGDTKKIEGAHVNLKDGTLTVAVSKLQGETLTIPLHDEARAVFKRRKRIHGDGYLFPGREGGHVTSFRCRVNQARKATGLKDFTFGEFRHNCATWLIEAGVDIYAVKDLLGHASVKTTERYAKLVGNIKRKAIDKLPALDLTD